MKQLSNELREFIIKNSALIDKDDFQNLYGRYLDAVKGGQFDGDYGSISQLTQILIDSRIVFLPFMKDVPMSCYNGLSIKTVHIPSNISNIEMYAFNHCTELTEVFIAEGVKALYSGAFADCKALKTITLPDSMTKVDLSAFAQSGLEELKMPHSIKYIDTRLAGCDKLKSIYLPKCEYIDEGLVRYCRRLKDIYFEGTEDDWLYAFSGKIKDSVNIHFNAKY